MRSLELVYHSCFLWLLIRILYIIYSRWYLNIFMTYIIKIKCNDIIDESNWTEHAWFFIWSDKLPCAWRMMNQTIHSLLSHSIFNIKDKMIKVDMPCSLDNYQNQSLNGKWEKENSKEKWKHTNTQK